MYDRKNFCDAFCILKINNQPHHVHRSKRKELKYLDTYLGHKPHNLSWNILATINEREELSEVWIIE